MTQPVLASTLSTVRVDGVSVTSFTYSVTVGSAGQAIVLQLGWYHSAARDVSSVVRNGQNFSAATTKNDIAAGLFGGIQQWVLLNADVGTFDVTVTFSGAVSGYALQGELYNNATSFEGGVNTSEVAGSTTLTPTTATSDLKVIVGSVFNNSTSLASVTPVSPATTIAESLITSSGLAYGSYERICTAASQDMQITLSGNSFWASAFMLVGDAAPPARNIDVAQTIPAFGVSATLGVTVSADVAQIIPDFGIAATIGVTGSLSADQTIPDFGIAATIGVETTLSADQTIPDFGISSSVAVTVSANVAQTIPDFGLVALLSVGDARSIDAAQTIPDFGISATLEGGDKIIVDQTIPDFGIVAAIGVEVSASVAQTIPDFGLVALLSVGDARTISADQTIPDFGITSAVSVTVSVSVDQTIPDFGAAASLGVTVSAGVDQTIPDFGLVAELGTARLVNVDQTIPPFGIVATIDVTVSANVDQTIPDFGLVALVHVGQRDVVNPIIVLVPENRLLCRYDGPGVIQGDITR